MRFQKLVLECGNWLPLWRQVANHRKRRPVAALQNNHVAEKMAPMQKHFAETRAEMDGINAGKSIT
jgi:hypothetical protein